MKVPRLLALPGALLALALFCAAHGTAFEPPAEAPAAPPALSNLVPKGPEDLRALEKQVQAVVAKVTPAVVGVRVGAASGSGVIITADGFVLTAGHVSGKPGREVTVILPDGRKLKARTLGQNKGIDSGLLKISEPGPWPHAEMGKSEALRRGEWVVAIGHPGGFRANRTPVVRLGRVLLANRLFVRTDCTLVGGDSGGPLFDLGGRVVGIHSRIGGSITENVDVPVDTYRSTWDRLASGESWGSMFGQTVVHSPGGKVVLEVDGKLTRDDPRDSRRKQCFSKVRRLVMKPGSVYTIELVSPNPKRLDPYLRLEDAAGKQLAEDDDGAGNLNSRIVFRPRSEEDYRIVVTSCDPDQVGTFKLTVRRLDLRGEAAAGRVDVLKSLHMPNPPARLLFQQLAKQRVALFARATLFDAKGKLSPETALPFRWSGGGTTLKTDADGVARLKLTKDDARELVAEVPAGHRAAFELTDADGNLIPLPQDKGFDKERVKSAGGKVVFQVEGKLTDADPFDMARKQCRHKVYQLKMAPGSAYTLDLESLDFDSYLRLEDASGRRLAEDDDGGGRLNSRIVFRPTREETYRVIVTTCDPDQDGAFRLTVRQAEDRVAEKKQDKK